MINGGVTKSSGFSLGVARPVDYKYKAASLADRNATPLVYEGMMVYVDRNDTDGDASGIIYKLKPLDPSWTDAYGTHNDHWEPLGGTVGSVYIQTTAGALRDMMAAGTLEPLAWYSFAHRTREAITKEWNSSTECWEGPEETFIFQASSTNSFFAEGVSLLYPNERITYDFTSVTAPDGAPRTGKITFRKDVVRGISAAFDFRNVLSRFNRFRANAYDVNATTYTQGSVVEFGDDCYVAKQNVPAGWPPQYNDQYWLLFGGNIGRKWYIPEIWGIGTKLKNYYFDYNDTGDFLAFSGPFAFRTKLGTDPFVYTADTYEMFAGKNVHVQRPGNVFATSSNYVSNCYLHKEVYNMLFAAGVIGFQPSSYCGDSAFLGTLEACSANEIDGVLFYNTVMNVDLSRVKGSVVAGLNLAKLPRYITNHAFYEQFTGTIETAPPNTYNGVVTLNKNYDQLRLVWDTTRLAYLYQKMSTDGRTNTYTLDGTLVAKHLIEGDAVGAVDTVNGQSPDGSKNVNVEAQHIDFTPTDQDNTNGFFAGLLTGGKLKVKSALDYMSAATQYIGNVLIGPLSGLNTTDKSSVVAAINEVHDLAGNSTAGVTSVAGKTGVVTLDKSDVGLSNVDNTSDLAKPISTATQTALNAKQNSLGFTPVPDTRTVAGKPLTANVTLVKGDVGLSNVDNTSDLAKPVSTATQTALDGKVDKITGKGLSTEDYTTAEKTKLAGIGTGANVTSVAGKTGVVTLVKGDVGLSNVDNTSDLAKPISTATQTALNGKQASLGYTPVPDTRTVAGKALTADVTLAKADVGLGNVDNTSDATKNAAAATLTNKTISGASNTLSNIAQSSVTNLTTDLAGKQATLVSGTNIRTINGTSLLGSGDIYIAGGGGGGGAPANSTYSTSTASQAVATTETLIATVNITPTSNSAKFNIFANAEFLKDTGNTARTMTLRVKRGTTTIGIDTSIRSQSSASTPYGPASILVQDAPNTSATVTYNIYALVDAGASTCTRVTAQALELSSKGDKGDNGTIPTAYFSFNSDIDTSAEMMFVGKYTFSTPVISNRLLSVAFSTRLDTASTYTTHTNLAAMQAWIDLNVSASTQYWIRVIATYKTGETGEANYLLKYYN